MPLRGSYEGLPLTAVLQEVEERTGVIPRGWGVFLEYAAELHSEKAFAVMLPMTRKKALRRAAEEGVQDVAVRAAPRDVRTADQAYTAFDFLAVQSMLHTRVCVQLGLETVQEDLQAEASRPKPR